LFSCSLSGLWFTVKFWNDFITSHIFLRVFLLHHWETSWWTEVKNNNIQLDYFGECLEMVKILWTSINFHPISNYMKLWGGIQKSLIAIYGNSPTIFGNIPRNVIVIKYYALQYIFFHLQDENEDWRKNIKYGKIVFFSDDSWSIYNVLLIRY
jgi:hypothetical protein